MDEKQPLGQPITSKPGDPQYVPQPLGNGKSPKPKPNKKMWLIVGGIVGFLLLFGLAYWFMGQSAAKSYKEDAITYKQQIKQVRDDLNTTLDEQNISARNAKAPPIFEEYGKKLQGVVASAPKNPKVFGFMPVSGVGDTKQQVDSLTQAATNYANQLRAIYTFFTYITTTADQFKPIKDTTDVKALDDLWATFLTEFKKLTPSPGMEATHEELVKQAETLLTELKTFVDGFDQRTFAENSAIASELTKSIAGFNETFQKAVQDTTEESLAKVNQYYDELDAQLQ